MAKLVKEEVIAGLKEMNRAEIRDLVSAIETEFGVKAAAAEGPSEVTVTLKSFGSAKVPVIKAVQAITGLGLRDAKKLVDKAPVAIKEKISPAEAEEIKKQLVAAGAEVEVK